MCHRNAFRVSNLCNLETEAAFMHTTTFHSNSLAKIAFDRESLSTLFSNSVIRKVEIASFSCAHKDIDVSIDNKLSD